MDRGRKASLRIWALPRICAGHPPCVHGASSTHARDTLHARTGQLIGIQCFPHSQARASKAQCHQKATDEADRRMGTSSSPGISPTRCKAMPMGDQQQTASSRICREFTLGARRTPYASSFNQISTEASLGIRQSPRGLREMLPTLGPSGRQERLNCWLKKRRKNVASHFLMVSSS